MNILLFETIKVENGQIFNIEWHNKRFNKARLELFGKNKELKLEEYLTPPQKGFYRCKIRYDSEIQSVDYFPYQIKHFTQFQIIQSNLDYNYKYDNRSELQKLLKKPFSNDNYDEIIIEKNGLLTDTTIANIAFYDGENWFTPKVALLEGTTRARLLEEGFLKLKNIKKENIKNYSHFALMNAMIGFQIQRSINIRL